MQHAHHLIGLQAAVGAVAPMPLFAKGRGRGKGGAASQQAATPARDQLCPRGPPQSIRDATTFNRQARLRPTTLWRLTADVIRVRSPIVRAAALIHAPWAMSTAIRVQPARVAAIPGRNTHDLANINPGSTTTWPVLHRMHTLNLRSVLRF